MNADAMRIAVAEACGWKRISSGHWLPPGASPWFGGGALIKHDCPNYPGCLNACAQFEATLTDQEHTAFTGWLLVLAKGKRTVSASAPQRCEAFLKTKSLWTETQP